MTTTPLLGITQLEENQALPEVVVNEAVIWLEGFASFTVFEDRNLTAPPGSPSEGQRYLIAASATGAWAGHDGEIAYRINGAWAFFDAFEGLAAWIKDENELVVYDGAAWVDPVAAAGVAVEDDSVSEGTGILTLNFTGAGVSVNVTGTEAEIAIPGGGGAPAFRGALVKKAANQTGANYTTLTAVAWDSETGGYDTDSIHDNVTNNSRLTVPSGVTKVQLFSNVRIENKTATDWVQILIRKNGTDVIGLPSIFYEPGSATVMTNLASSVVDVTAGDYFQLLVQVESDTTIDIIAAQSWFAMEIVE